MIGSQIVLNEIHRPSVTLYSYNYAFNRVLLTRRRQNKPPKWSAITLKTRQNFTIPYGTPPFSRSSFVPSARCEASVVAAHDDAASLPPKSNERRFGVAAQQGPRDTMEDIIQVIPDARCGYLFASVFDGHAGISTARYLEQNLFRIFNNVLDMHSLGLDTPLEVDDAGLCCPLELHDVLTDCYRRADEDLLKWLSQQPPDETDSGCTATTALVRSDRVIVANVGDSRAVLSRKGTAIDLSTEHRVYGKGRAVTSETERVKSVGGWIEDGRVCGILAVSRAFGDADFKHPNLDRMLARGVDEGYWDIDFAANVHFTGNPVTSEPDVFKVGLEPEQDEFVVVATDGLWDVMSSQEVVNLVRADFRRNKHPTEIAERLAALAIKRHTADNTSIVIIDLLGKDGWAANAEPSGGKKAFFGLF